MGGNTRNSLRTKIGNSYYPEKKGRKKNIGIWNAGLAMTVRQKVKSNFT